MPGHVIQRLKRNRNQKLKPHDLTQELLLWSLEEPLVWLDLLHLLITPHSSQENAFYVVRPNSNIIWLCWNFYANNIIINNQHTSEPALLNWVRRSHIRMLSMVYMISPTPFFCRDVWSNPTHAYALHLSFLDAPFPAALIFSLITTLALLITSMLGEVSFLFPTTTIAMCV